MSDFIAIAVVRGRAIHLVDWDRPCWFRPDAPNGDRLIPDLEGILTDALLFFSYDDFDMPFDLFAGQRGKNRVFEMKDASGIQNIDEARKVLRGRNQPFILLAHFGSLDSHLKKDIDMFKTPILSSQINQSQARKFGIG
jgi:hypothetical protein